ncbi:hypothetical protein [Caballeronia sp. INDeC2]|uniref:hypothetical protein n=1 Tax=Caballeronia sp. INDeC2 TaxID=2921747 RepID=UPI002028DA6D|nr:hypothetical protein [Caballeronia sp. INDeC2]
MDRPTYQNGAASFEESKDRDYADWKRLRLVIEHENTLVNHRLTWLLGSQTVFFAALAFTLKDWDATAVALPRLLFWLSFVVVVIGSSTALLVWRGLSHAQEHIARVDRWWYADDRAKVKMFIDRKDTRFDRTERQLRSKDRLPLHPPLQHQTDRRLDSIFNPYNIPACFLLIWAAILGFLCTAHWWGSVVGLK